MPRYASQGRRRGNVSHRVRCISRSLLAGDLTVLERLLPAHKVRQAIAAEGVQFRERLFPPLVTLWVFLLQVLDADGSCRAAVVRLMALLSAGGQGNRVPCGAGTGPYCKARQRLPEKLLSRLACETGQALDRQFPIAAKGLLGGRALRIVDGTTCSMPDTPENQGAWPQPPTQKTGLGFPLVRLVAILSLNCAAVLDLAMGSYAGKQQGESALFRMILSCLKTGDILLADRYYASYWMMALLLERGVDSLFRQHQLRRIDFRAGRRLGPDDHVITLVRPSQRPEWMDDATYQRMPDTLEVREIRVRVCQRGFRVRSVVLVTTLLDAQVYSRAEIAEAFRLRWHVELDLRAIKQTMGMSVLRCKRPEMVRKEIWMHLLAYNLIRTVMAEAAQTAGRQPREISFAGTVQTINAFAPVLQCAATRDLPRLWELLLYAVSRHRVGNRPDRYEPRAVKRRAKPIALLTVPRQQARHQLIRKAIAA